MELEYDIYYGEKIAGKAIMKQQGLYYQIECSCHFPTKELYRVFLRTSGTEINLGVCVPAGDIAKTRSKISINRVDLSSLHFYISLKNENTSAYFPVYTGCDFIAISQLRSSSFCLYRNEPAIKINENTFNSQNLNL